MKQNNKKKKNNNNKINKCKVRSQNTKLEGHTEQNISVAVTLFLEEKKKVTQISNQLISMNILYEL